MSEKITLVMDSSGPVLRVGVQQNGKIYSARRKGVKQERFLLPVVQRVLAKAGAELGDIGRVFFVRGPGRFTGIRISLTFASMLQALNGSRPCAATLFEILYKQVTDSAAFAKWQKAYPQGIAVVVLHAFREEYFLQFFDGKNTGPQWLGKGELLQKLAACKKPLYLAGTDKDGLSLRGLVGDSYTIAPSADCQLRLQTLLEMAKNPLYCKSVPQPLYLKPARFELGQ